MLQQSSAVLLLLLVVSVASRVVAETGEPTRVLHAQRLLEKALYWESVATPDAALRLQHAATALAFLAAAR